MKTDQPTWSESANRLQMALDAARMIAWELHVGTGRLEYASPNDIEHFAEHPSLVARLIDAARNGTGQCLVEFRFATRDGGATWMRYQGTVTRDERREPVRATGVAMVIPPPVEEGELLRSIAETISPATGETFFRLLAQQMCTLLRTDFACIAELDDHDPGIAHAFAMFENNKFHDEMAYELSNTPCEKALAWGRCSYPQNVRSLFPLDRQLADMGIESYLGVALRGSHAQPLGVMSVMSRSPLKNVSSAETVLDIFAGRASAELERRRAERALSETDARSRAILSALPDLVLLLDRHGVIQNVYSEHSDNFGLTKASILGEQLTAVLAAEPATLILDAAARLKSNAPAIVEYSLWDSGEPRFYEARTVILDDEKLLTIIRDTTHTKLAESQLEESRRFIHRIGETTPNVLFVFDLVERRNVYVNERSMDVLGFSAKEILEMGERFVPQFMHPDDLAQLPALAQEYAGRRDGEVFEHTFRMRHKNGQYRWVHRSATIFSRTPDGSPKQILGAVTDITEFKNTERELQELSARLLTIQDKERRRIARELHDVTGQNLAAIGFHLSALERSEQLSAAAKNTIAECHKLCVESQKEVRTLSYLLHPPMLDPFGLVRTLEWYIDGLRKRSSMEILLDMPEAIERLPIELETDLFRVIQEGLTNIMRHSDSVITVIRLAKKDEHIVLQIEDRGEGLKVPPKEPAEKGFGVGIPSMRERIRQHGGTLEVITNQRGTTLTVRVPENRGAKPGETG